jgi:hypothetical protein
MDGATRLEDIFFAAQECAEAGEVASATELWLLLVQLTADAEPLSHTVMASRTSRSAHPEHGVHCSGGGRAR